MIILRRTGLWPLVMSVVLSMAAVSSRAEENWEAISQAVAANGGALSVGVESDIASLDEAGLLQAARNIAATFFSHGVPLQQLTLTDKNTGALLGTFDQASLQ